MIPMPDFKSHAERDAWFKENAQYYTLVKKTGVGKYSRDEYYSLEEALKAGKTKALIGGGGYMVYAVVGEQSALVTTIK